MKSKNFLVYALILGLIFLVWHKVLGQCFLGEAYMYFPPNQNFFIEGFKLLPSFNNYNNSAKILFDILPSIFKDNIQHYLLFQLLTISVLGWSIFLVLKNITKNKLISLISVCLFLTNYTASFEMMATGTYQRFAERVFGIITGIISFYFLSKYYQKNKLKYLFISLILFIFGLYLGHYTTFILPIFIVYPLAQFLFNPKNRKTLFNNLTVIFLFVVIDFIITKGSNQNPGGNILEFITQKNFAEKILLQIPAITIPPNIIRFLSKLYPQPLPAPFVPILKILFYPASALYLAGFIITRKQSKSIKIIYFTAFFAMILEMFLYMFVDRRLNILVNFGETRFFYITSIFASICWGTITAIIFQNRKYLYKIISALIFAIYILYNYLLINNNIQADQYKSEMMQRYVAYIKNISPNFTEKTVIITPSYIMWPGPMIEQFYGKPKMTVIRDYEGWESDLRQNSGNVIVIDYDYDKTKNEEVDQQRGHVVDLTAKYRRGEKIKFLNY